MSQAPSNHNGETFTLRIGDVMVPLTKTAGGWRIPERYSSGNCSKSGHPFLFKHLDRQGVIYPPLLSSYLTKIWWYADRGAEAGELHAAIEQLSAWLTSVHEQAPRGEPWRELFDASSVA